MQHPKHDHDHAHNHDHPHGKEHCWYKGGPFVDELTSHLPFSILSVSFGLMAAGLICFFASPETLSDAAHTILAEHGNHDKNHAGHDQEQNSGAGFLILFHLFHPAHMLFSGAATAAMFMRHEGNWFKGILVGLTGAIVVCGISDILIPHASALIMKQHLPLHICILQHPGLVLPFAGVGVLLGVFSAAGGTLRSTIFSHSIHVFASTMASIFYLISAFGRFAWINQLGLVFFFICVAVVIPCCLSDIVYPLLFTREARAKFTAYGHVHPK